MKQKTLAILGPTATGKSDLSIKLAKQFNGEIISADSRQVYRNLDIGTGKITKKEMCGIRHYLLDIINPRLQFTVVKFVKLAEKAILEISKKGKLPIICGGTGFYIQALLNNTILPEVPPNEKLRKELDIMSTDNLFKILLKLDPNRAKNIDRKNPHRLIRAIEIASAIGKVPNIEIKPDKYDTLFIGLKLPSDELKSRIQKRLLKRLKSGMLDEAYQLHKQGLSWKRMGELGLEYRYMARCLEGKINKKEMIEKLNIEIWHYAKRQITWFKRDRRIKWFEPKDIKSIRKTIINFLY